MKKLILFTILAFFFGCKTKSPMGSGGISGQPDPMAGCVDTDNPFAVEWMDKAIDYHNPTQVIQYKVDDRWQYLFQSIPDGYLYDCEGRLICVTQNDHDPCHDKIILLGRGKTIWQGEGVWD